MPRVVIVALDGLQMWQVTPESMPNLSAFANEGVRFERHHPVFPSVTRLNAATIVTGCYPAAHGIAGNRMVFRDVDASVITNVLEPELREVARATDGRVLLRSALAERLATHGLDYAAVVSGTSGNAYCHAPNAARTGGATIHPEFCLPDDLFDQLEDRFGPWPEEAVPNAARLTRATDIFLEYVVGDRDSDVALIWYSEPDKSQHAHGVSSAVARTALRAADNEFGRLLGDLPESTDVLVVSDHGYSTVTGNIDIATELRDAGFASLGEPGGVGGAANGGTALMYLTEPENGVARRLADWVTGQAWCGAVLAAERVGDIKGTLPASLAGVDGLRGPDLAVSTRWTLDEAGGGVALTNSFGDLPPPQGDHGAMSRTELRNTLIARGPHFKSAVRSETPSGNVDLMPTVLHLLELPDAGCDGRVLSEGLSGGREPSNATTTDYTASAAGYEQYVRISTVDAVAYVDEGNSF